MVVLKVINNNIVSASDEGGHEIIAMGRGIGFGTKPGKTLLKNRIEKVFRMDSESSSRQLEELLSDIPLEHIQLSNEIIDYVKSVMDKKLNKNIYITLTDHINFAIERYRQGMNFSNPLLYEVSVFYKKEFDAGKYALRLIRERIGIDLPEDEAASIALHIVNAEYNAEIGEMMNMTKLISQILKIVSDFFEIKLNQESLNFERFVTHLKFFVLRIYKHEEMYSDSSVFDTMIETQFAPEYECSKKIADFVAQEYHHTVQKEELSYLTMHIHRVTHGEKRET